MKFKRISEERGDCTSAYNVILDKEYKVHDFIQEVLKQNGWGYIGIYDENKSIFGSPNCSYRNDKLLCNLPEKYMDEIIEDVTASGGGRRMDYIIKVRKEI